MDNLLHNSDTVSELAVPSYSWQVSQDNGITFTNLTDAPNAPSLTLSNIVASQHNNYYRVVATSGSHTIISKPAKLIIFPDVTITNHPINQTAVSGTSSLSFTANISANAQKLYQWEFSTRDQPDSFSSMPNETGTSLNLTGLTSAQDDYSYRAKITAKYSNNFPRTIYTNPAIVNIDPPPIVITKQPSDSFVSSEGTGIFSVTATSNDGVLSYQWQESVDGINYTDISDNNTNVLNIISLQKDLYKYRVHISSENNSITSNSATLHTSVELPSLNNLVDNTIMWGDPHLRIQSTKGAIGNIDDNCCSTPIVFFYIKEPNGDSYKVVLNNKFALGRSAGPATISDVLLYKNGQLQTPIQTEFGEKSLQTPSNNTILDRCTFAGVTGYSYSKGKTLSFSSNFDTKTLDDTNYGQLLTNSIKWLSNNKTNPNILIIGTNTSIDTVLRNKITSLMSCSVSLAPSPYNTYATFSNTTNLLNNIDVVILMQGDPKSTTKMTTEAQISLLNYVKAGGSILTSAWVGCGIKRNLYGSLADAMPIYGSVSYVNKSPIRYIKNIQNSILNSNLPEDFTFSSLNTGSNAGTEVALMSIKPEAIMYYASEQCIKTTAKNIFKVGEIMTIIDSTTLASNWGVFHQPSFMWNNTISYSGKIRIGGAYYWILKSLIEAKKRPLDPLNAIWKSRNLIGATADGYGAVIKRYGLTRQKLSNAVGASDNSQEILDITEEIELKDTFWKDLSKLLAGLVPDSNLYLKNKVYFVKQPGNRLANINSSVSFDVSALTTGTEAVSYQWQVSSNNGETYANINTSDRTYNGTRSRILTINSPKLIQNNYLYRAIVSAGNAATKQSLPAKLTVVESIAVSSFPVEKQAINGNATFSVTASSTDGDLRYQWQTSRSSRVSSFTNISGANSSSLSVSVDSYNQNDTFYRVLLSNNNYSFTTNPVKLLAAPSITIYGHPQNYTTNNGEATFYVSADFAKIVNFTNMNYQWQSSTNNRSFTNINGATSSTLTLTNLNQTHNNRHYRVALTIPTSSTDSRPRLVVYSNSAKLTVLSSILASPVKILSSYKKVNNIDYTDVILEVLATNNGGGSLSYQWQQSKNKGITYSNIAGSNSSQIGVNNIPKNSYLNYKYRVLITNSNETITVD